MKTNQIVALIFVLLMVGSSVGAMLMNIFGPKEEQLQIPQERIITYKLSEQQRKYLLSQGFTLVEYAYPSICFECESQKTKLESWTQDSDGQMFLQELSESDATQTTVTITSLKGQETLYDTSDQELQDTLCELLLARPLWCVQI